MARVLERWGERVPDEIARSGIPLDDIASVQDLGRSWRLRLRDGRRITLRKDG